MINSRSTCEGLADGVGQITARSQQGSRQTKGRDWGDTRHAMHDAFDEHYKRAAALFAKLTP